MFGARPAPPSPLAGNHPPPPPHLQQSSLPPKRFSFSNMLGSFGRSKSDKVCELLDDAGGDEDKKKVSELLDNATASEGGKLTGTGGEEKEGVSELLDDGAGTGGQEKEGVSELLDDATASEGSKLTGNHTGVRVSQLLDDATATKGTSGSGSGRVESDNNCDQSAEIGKLFDPFGDDCSVVSEVSEHCVGVTHTHTRENHSVCEYSSGGVSGFGRRRRMQGVVAPIKGFKGTQSVVVVSDSGSDSSDDVSEEGSEEKSEDVSEEESEEESSNVSEDVSEEAGEDGSSDEEESDNSSDNSSEDSSEGSSEDSSEGSSEGSGEGSGEDDASVTLCMKLPKPLRPPLPTYSPTECISFRNHSTLQPSDVSCSSAPVREVIQYHTWQSPSLLQQESKAMDQRNEKESLIDCDNKNTIAIQCDRCKLHYSRPSSSSFTMETDKLPRVPKYLNCLHTFCLSCLVNISDSMIVTCPTCGVETVLPLHEDSLDDAEVEVTMESKAKAVARLPTAYPTLTHIPVQCQNCECSDAVASWCCMGCPLGCALLCDECVTAHSDMKAFRSHKVVPFKQLHSNSDNTPTGSCIPHCDVSSSLQHMPCPTHTGQAISGYCEECNKLVCLFCTCDSPERHKLITLSDHMNSMKHEMNHNKTTVENIVADLSVKLNQYSENFQNIPTERHVVSAKLEEITKELAAIISTSEVICNDFTKKEYIRKRDELSAFELEVRDELVKQEQLKKTISDVIKDKGDFQLLTAAKFMEKQTQEVSSGALSANKLDSEIILLSENMKKADKLTGSCGLVRGSLMSADPAKSHIQIKTGSYLDDFACIEIRIVLLNSEGCCVHSGGYPVTVELFDAVGNVLVFAENTKFVSHDIVSESNEGGAYAAQGSRLPSPKFMLLDNLDGSYNFICFSRNNLFVSCHVKVLGEHISGSPSTYFPSYVDDDSNVTEVFGPTMGTVAQVSSTYVIRRSGLESVSHSAENLRIQGTENGWMSTTEGNCVETVAILFPDIVLIHHLTFLNWGSTKYQVTVRRCKIEASRGQVEDAVTGISSGKYCGHELQIEQEWVCLDATLQLTPVPATQRWQIVIDKAERDRLGPIDAIRLDISGGSNTAFYSFNVFGFMLHEEIDSI